MADHSERNRQVLKDYLSEKGYNIEEASTIEDALTKSEHNGYTCIVSAIDFPGSDGLEFMHKLKNAAPKTPIIALSSQTSISKAVQTMQEGAFSVIQKPFMVIEVAQAVDEAISAAKKTERIQPLLPSIITELNFEGPGTLGMMESLIDHITAEVLNNVIPENEESAFRASVRCALHNAIIHGNKADEKKKVQVQCSHREEGYSIYIKDEGEGFNPMNYVNPEDLASSAAKEQRGLLRIYCYMDNVSFNEKGNEIRLFKKRKKIGS